MTEKTLKLVYAACAVQFLGVMVYVNAFCKPVTRSHLAIVALSAMLGLMLSGHARRYYDSSRKRSRDAEYQALDEKLKKLREENGRQ